MELDCSSEVQDSFMMQGLTAVTHITLLAITPRHIACVLITIRQSEGVILIPSHSLRDK